MNNLKVFSFSVLILLSIDLYSQEDQKESIITDRPDQTESAFLVPKGNLQLETGFQYKNIYGFQDHFIFNTTLFRYGLFNFLELRLNVEYSSFQYTGKLGTPEKLEGFEPIFVGVKIPLIKEKGIIPQIAFMGHLTLPIGSNGLKPDKVLPDFRLNFENTLSDRFSLGYNLGMEWEEDATAFIYTIALGADITDKLGVFIEPFGRFYPSGMQNYNMSEHYINGGVTFLVMNNIQLDAYGGTAYTHKEYFAGLGFSIRIPD